MNRFTIESEFGNLGFYYFIYLCSTHVSDFMVLFRRFWMVRVVFVVFIVTIVLIRVWFVLISGFVSVNFVLELIVHENLWLLQMFFFFVLSVFYVCIYNYVFCVHVCVYICIHARTSMYIYTSIHTFSGLFFSFLSLNWMCVRMYLTPPKDIKIVCACICLLLWVQFCLHVCVKLGSVKCRFKLIYNFFSFIWSNELSVCYIGIILKIHSCIHKVILIHGVFYFLVK